MSALRILTYHRVAERESRPDLNPRLISATPESFTTQMEHLRRCYRVLELDEVLAIADSGRKLPRRSVLITFDDAYVDFGEVAWPILRSKGLPATVFVPTAFPGNEKLSFWWDRLHRSIEGAAGATYSHGLTGSLDLSSVRARQESLIVLMRLVKTLPSSESQILVDTICEELGERPAIGRTVLSWDQLRQLTRDGVSLGAHTRTHPILSRTATDDLKTEIIGSQDDLLREIGEVRPVFCYPDGGYSDTVLELLRQKGFRLAFTTQDGTNRLQEHELLELKRTNVTPRTTPSVFALRMLPLFSHIDAWRHRPARVAS